MTPEERVFKSYYERLSAFQVEKSRVIAIEFESQDPELAAQVANAVAEAYLVLQQAAKQEQTRAAGTWLSGEIDRLRANVAAGGGQGGAIPLQDQSVRRQQQYDAVEPAARRFQRPARLRARAESGCRGEGEDDPRCAEGRHADRILGHHQFRAAAAAVRAARHAARAARRAILDAPRPASPHQGIARAGRGSRTPDAHGGRSSRALARERRQAGERQRSTDSAPPSTSSSARRPPATSRTCSCAPSSAMPSRSAICSNPIWRSTARRRRATASARRRPMRASSRLRSSPTRRRGRRSCRPSWSRRSPCSRSRRDSS